MTTTTQPRTIGELRESGYKVLSVKEEMRKNLIKKIREGETLFPGIIGYEETVIPQIENALLSGQDIIFLGERGQAKTRIARSLVNLLDEEVPVIAGCEINDDPYAPICKACRDKVDAQGDRVEISWLPRDRRYGEKLATPDITISDLVGEVDPVRVAEGRYLSDELTIHYGMILVPIVAFSVLMSCRTLPREYRLACSILWKSAMCRYVAIKSVCPSTSMWLPVPILKTIPIEDVLLLR